MIELTQIDDRYLYKDVLFSHLERMYSESWTDKTVYLTSGSVAGDSATSLLAGPAFTPLLSLLGILSLLHNLEKRFSFGLF